MTVGRLWGITSTVRPLPARLDSALTASSTTGCTRGAVLPRAGHDSGPHDIDVERNPEADLLIDLLRQGTEAGAFNLDDPATTTGTSCTQHCTAPPTWHCTTPTTPPPGGSPRQRSNSPAGGYPLVGRPSPPHARRLAAALPSQPGRRRRPRPHFGGAIVADPAVALPSVGHLVPAVHEVCHAAAKMLQLSLMCDNLTHKSELLVTR